MARRLFPRNHKDAPEEESQFESDADRSLSRTIPPPGHGPASDTGPHRESVSEVPAIAPPDQRAPGWYADTTDSGLMRYWDGFHFTGQAKRAISARPSTGDAQPSVQTVPPLTTDVPSIDWSHPEVTELEGPTQFRLPLSLQNRLQSREATRTKWCHLRSRRGPVRWKRSAGSR